jgi:hypothetical protein
VFEVIMVIDDINELLKDGKSIHISMLGKELGQTEEKIEQVLSFCVAFDIVTIDENSQVYLNKCFKNLYSDFPQ